MTRVRLLPLFVLMLVAACGDDTAVPPHAARLAVEIAGLPEGASAPVTLTFENGETIAVPRSRVFDLVVPGEYVVRAENAVLGFGDFYPAGFVHAAQVPAGESTTIRVDYVGVLTRGGLRATARGLPDGTPTTFTVAGPDGFETTLAAGDSLDSLDPGTYSMSGERVADGDRVWAPWPDVVAVDVTAGAWTTAELAYAAAYDVSLDLTVAHVELSQATQRDDGSVPLIAGREAYLRVFGLASEPTQESPAVRVEWLLDGSVIGEDVVTRAATGAPTVLSRADLDASWNLRVPGSLVRPGLGYRVTVDPDDAVPEAVEANNAWPEDGEAVAVPVTQRDILGVRLVPVLQSANGQLGDATLANAPQYVAATRQLMPVSDVDVDLHDVYTTSAPPLQSDDGNRAWGQILSELIGLRAVEDTEGRHYYGVVHCTYSSGIAGLGRLPGYVAMGWDSPGSRAEVLAHELGHNLGLPHAPCGGPDGVDPDYPHAGGLIGAWGLDVAAEAVHDPAVTHDLMSYCRPKWISDYMFEKAMTFEMPADGTRAARTTCLLIWGGIRGGDLVLDPALVVETAPSLPDRAGPYTLIVRDGGGRPVVSLDVALPVTADLPAGDTAFAWTVPLPADKAASLASIELQGPVGRAVRERTAAAKAGRGDPAPTLARAGDLRLRWDADAYPLAMVRRPVEGVVLGVVRGGEATVRADPGELEFLLSDGVRAERLVVTAP